MDYVSIWNWFILFKMNDLVISELSAIKSILLAIFTILVFIGFYMSINLIRIYKNTRLEVEHKIRERFISEAHCLEDVGKYDLLSKLAKMRISSHPEDPNGYWFLALAKYRNKEWINALKALKQIQRIDVSWNKFTVEQYIEDAQSQLKGPEKRIT